jgi:phenylpropionate dioxygenase-like ring-hydroxylating dioxygenase large terminal subunit
MLSAVQNELITRVGPGTPLNGLLKHYWQPALLASEIAEPGCDPVRFSFCGERYIAFRDSDGKAGVFAEACCHRGSSLALARVEDGGIRCIFHGWKFATDGTLLDTPNVAEESFKQRFRGNAFPTREAADLVWVYFGPRDEQPPFREYEYMTVPSSHRLIMRMKLDCNWMQVLEGGLDSTHVGILHAEFAKSFETRDASLPEGLQAQAQVYSTDFAPALEVRDTDFGFHYAALRDAGDGANVHARITAYVFPNTTMIPPNMFVIHYVPYDDTHTAQIVTYWDKHRPVDRERTLRVLGLDKPGVWIDDHIEQCAENNWLQDRAKMRAGSWSGLDGLGQEDSAVNLSQGPILDRTKETLVPADVACIHVRKMLLNELERAPGATPPLAQVPERSATIQALEVTIPRHGDWTQSVPGNLPALSAGAAR